MIPITHMTVQELAAIDATAQAAASELRAAVTLLERERAGVQTRLDATGLDDNMMHAAGARERLRRLDAALQEQTAQRDAAVTRTTETAGDLAAARTELERAEKWLADLRAATIGQVAVMRIMDWRSQLESCREVIQRRAGQVVALPSVPPELASGTKQHETARSVELVN